MIKTYSSVFVIIGTLCAGACDRPRQPQEVERVSGDEVADKLEDAALQSGPAARGVLTEAAQMARQYPSLAPVEQPGSYAQKAMQDAGNAETSKLEDGSSAVP